MILTQLNVILTTSEFLDDISEDEILMFENKIKSAVLQAVLTLKLQAGMDLTLTIE